MKEIIKKIAISIILSGVISCFIIPVSCKLTPEGIKIITSDYNTPAIESVSVTGEKNLRIVFSKSIKLKKYSVNEEISISECNVETCPDKGGVCFVELTFDSVLEPGFKYSLFGIVSDEIGNTLTFSVPFTGINSNIPDMRIVEVHPTNGKYSVSGNPVLITEYVVFDVLSDGNLAGLEFYSAYDGEEKKFVFPPVKVKQGEKIVLHLRTNEEGTISETGDDLSLSTAGFSKNNVRDLWQEENSARLGDKIDILYLKNSYDERIIDGLCYAASSNTDWPKESFTEACKLLIENNVWQSDLVEDAILSDGLSTTKSLVRVSDFNCKDSWIISPCKENAAKL